MGSQSFQRLRSAGGNFSPVRTCQEKERSRQVKVQDAESWCCGVARESRFRSARAECASYDATHSDLAAPERRRWSGSEIVPRPIRLSSEACLPASPIFFFANPSPEQ